MANDTTFNNTNELAKEGNRDPITGAPGAHPVGTGVGATGGAIAGAAAGSLAGPVGTVVGLVAGGIAGGLGGKAVAEGVNPTAEDAYWRDAHKSESYYESGVSYEDYRPAYEAGWTGRAAGHTDFEAAEPSLRDEWATRRGTSSLSWDRARPATRAAWERADRTYYGEAAMGGAAGAAAGWDDDIDTDAMSNDDVVDVLNNLLETTRDGEYGFRTCAEEVETSSVREVFTQRAADCQRGAQELTALIVQYGGTPADGGTTSGALHRGWVHVKGAVGANSELSILEESERGEDVAVAQYRKALKRNLPADVRSVVQSQAQGAQRNHDQIRDLRNASRDRR